MIPRVLLILLSCGLLACGGNSRAPVEDRYARQSPPAPVKTLQTTTNYRVQGGDTLYSIAFRYGLDYRKLAAANNIPAPYTIYPGRVLLLREGSLPPVPAVKPRPKTTATKKPTGSTKPSSPGPAKPPSGAVARTPLPPPAKPAAEIFVGSKVSSWRWPTSGRVVRGYSGSVHKGIDIEGNRGDAIAAVAAGKVVYAGSGILGLGELLIVKHNDVYLSAYGHNDRLLVAEGQTVKAGQTIAHKGNSGTDAVKLHFEIRKAGKPIDPQRLLPRR